MKIRQSALACLSALTLLLSCTATAETPKPDDSNLADTKGPVLLVGNKGEDSLSFIDLTTGREVARRPTGPNPHEIAVSPDGNLAAIVNYGGAAIEVFLVTSGERIETINLGANRRPHGIVWLADGRIITTTEVSETLTVISPPTGEAQQREISAIATGQKGTHMVAIAVEAERAYTANMGSGSVSVIDLAGGKKIADWPVGTEPEGLALTPDEKTLWVADRQGAALHVFDTASGEKLATLKTGNFPIRVAISPDGMTAVTSNYADGSLSLFDVAQRKKTRDIKVSGQQGAGQVTILFSRDGERIYVAETGINKIAEVDVKKGAVIGRLSAGTNGDGLAIANPARTPAD